MNKSLFIFPLLLFLSFSCNTTTQSPEIEFAVNNINLGNIPKGGTKTGQVILKNVGKENLTINGIKSDCLCTDVNINKKLIKPTETAIISFTFSDTFEGSSGKFNIPIIVKSNSIKIFDDFYITGIVEKGI